MGSGKTTLGKQLSLKMNKPFFDLDAEIEKSENRSIIEIFDNYGETYFRDLESKILKEIILKNKSFILSLGGGTPCFNNNMEIVNISGISIYLKYKADILASRLINAKAGRPLLKNLDETQLKEFISDKLIKREPFYSHALYIINKNSISVKDLVFHLKID